MMSPVQQREQIGRGIAITNEGVSQPPLAWFLSLTLSMAYITAQSLFSLIYRSSIYTQ